MIEFDRGFFTFDKSWILENEFMQSLSHAEFRVMVYLAASTLRISKRDQRYKTGDSIATLYQRNRILFVNVSQPTIAERCKVDRSTVYEALKKFREFGAVIKVPEGKPEVSGDYYILGFEKTKEGKQDYFLVDSLPIRSGNKLPDKYKEFIRDHYKDEFFSMSDLIWRDLFGMKNEHGIRIGLLDETAGAAG